MAVIYTYQYFFVIPSSVKCVVSNIDVYQWGAPYIEPWGCIKFTEGKALEVPKALLYKFILVHHLVEKIFMLWVRVVLVGKASYGWGFMNIPLLSF